MIYLDHAATTKIDPEVLAAMLPYLGEYFGNASSLYALGRESRRAIETAREMTAAFFGVRPKEILFTSGGSESDNLALRGVAWAQRHRGNHLITTQVEHHAVLRSCEALEKQVFEVTYLAPYRHGRIEAAQVVYVLTVGMIVIRVLQ